MTASNFAYSDQLTKAYEGGYVNNPKDPGGPTFAGITQAVYDAYRRSFGLLPKPVRDIAAGEITSIYKGQYWKLINGDRLPTGVDYAVYDFAVNSGVGRATRYLQLALGVKTDGVLGAITLGKLDDADPVELIVRICSDRMAFLQGLGTFPTFGKGWTRRVVGAKTGYQADDTGVIDYAVNMTKAALVPLKAPKFIGAMVGEPQTAKAVNDDFGFMPSAPMSYEELKAGRWAA